MQLTRIVCINQSTCHSGPSDFSGFLGVSVKHTCHIPINSINSISIVIVVTAFWWHVLGACVWAPCGMVGHQYCIGCHGWCLCLGAWDWLCCLYIIQEIKEPLHFACINYTTVVVFIYGIGLVLSCQYRATYLYIITHIQGD